MTPPKRQRLMMVAPHYEEYAWRLCRALAAEGAEVLLATDLARLRRDFADRELHESPHLRLEHVRGRSPRDLLRLVRLVAQFRPSILHIQEPSGLRKAMIATALVTVARPFCRIALTVHDPEPHNGRDLVIAARLRRFRNYVRAAAHVVLVHGEHCRARYAELHPRKGQPLVSVDHGEILADAAPEPRSHGVLSLLCFGRMEAYKGLGILHEALALLDAEGALPAVLIAGTGPELDRLASEFARLAPRVHVVNEFVPSSRLIAELRAHDCVVMPYLTATQSGVLAAAFANGCFVIASDVGGLRDTVEDGVNGLLVPPGDPAALAAAIRRAADDPELRRRLASGARETAHTRLKWDTIAVRTLESYG
jgi:glycosyltransferase involved in cell wall biosynthesis